MTRDEQLEAQIEKYTLTPDPQQAEELREIVRRELADEDREDNEIIKLSCAQLFYIGEVEDSLLAWKAKRSGFDAALYLDIQLLCGAGFNETKTFLAQQETAEAAEALKYLAGCEKAGDFEGWTVEWQNKVHQRYFCGS